MVQLFNLAQSGNHKDGLKLHINIQKLHCLLECDPGYVSPCKEALSMLGLPGGPVREPLPELNPMKEMHYKVLLGRSISSRLRR